MNHSYLDRLYNEKFAKVPRRPDNLHRALNVEPDRLRDILCLRDERYVGKQLVFSYERKRIVLDENEVSRNLPGQYVDSYEFADGCLEFRWKGIKLPYSVFDKDQQRITHAAIVENKRLGAVLEQIRQEQEKSLPPAHRVGRQRTKYTPAGRKSPGRTPIRTNATPLTLQQEITL